MAQWLEILEARLDNLSSVPKIHISTGEVTPVCVMWLLCVSCDLHMYSVSHVCPRGLLLWKDTMMTAIHFFLFFLFVVISKFVKNKNTAILSAEQQLNKTTTVNKAVPKVQASSRWGLRLWVCAHVCARTKTSLRHGNHYGAESFTLRNPRHCTFSCLCILCHFLPVDLVTTTKISFLLFSFSRFSDFLEMEEPLKSNICFVYISLSLLTIDLESDDRPLDGTEEILNLAVRLAFLKA